MPGYRGGSSRLEGALELWGQGSIEVVRHLEDADVAAKLSSLRVLDGNQAGHGLAAARDDNLLPGRYAPQQPREVGLRLVHADLCHLAIVN